MSQSLDEIIRQLKIVCKFTNITVSPRDNGTYSATYTYSRENIDLQVKAVPEAIRKRFKTTVRDYNKPPEDNSYRSSYDRSPPQPHLHFETEGMTLLDVMSNALEVVKHYAMADYNHGQDKLRKRFGYITTGS
jgi:hypothetical protein